MLEVIFCDNHQLVVNKPSGLLTQPNETNDPSLEAIAKEWIKQENKKTGNVYLHAVHRLDRPASGIVLFARTSKSLSRLNLASRGKQVKKYYVALVEGAVTPSQAVLEHYLTHDSHHAKISTKRDPNAKLARLSYRVLQQKTTYTFLEVELDTGRYHQIRAQLAAIGHPIIGDTKYGSTTSFEGIALHHSKLLIPHPITGAMQTFETARPTWAKDATVR